MDVNADALSLEASSLSSVEDDGQEYGAEISSASLFAFTPADHELLVRLVKLAQKRAYTTKLGPWKDYLTKAFKLNQPRDPARHPWNALADFIEALEGDEVRKQMQVVVEWERRVEEDAEMNAPAVEATFEGPPEGSLWHLVNRTARHPRFDHLYRFPSHDDTWTRIRGTPAFDQEPTLLAIDCEMCVTEDDDKALLSLCVVDTDGGRVMHEMVKPDSPVKDFLTAITGHTADDLVGLTYTRAAAIEDLLQHLHSERVVLVGHALHHDLRALRLDYQPVIDTSLLLPYKDLPNAAPPLTDLVTRLLGRQLRQEGDPHDVTADAHASMDLALYEHQKGPTPGLEAPLVEVSDSDRKRLLVHAMPAGMRDVDVIFLFPPGCPPISDIQRESKQATKAFVTFGSPIDAQSAFDMLDGHVTSDSRGRAQKKVKVPAATEFKNAQVRIRVLHFDPVAGQDTPTKSTVSQSVGNKRKFADRVII